MCNRTIKKQNIPILEIRASIFSFSRDNWKQLSTTLFEWTTRIGHYFFAVDATSSSHCVSVSFIDGDTTPSCEWSRRVPSRDAHMKQKPIHVTIYVKKSTHTANKYTRYGIAWCTFKLKLYDKSSSYQLNNACL
jgi:hypothetical protein